jgi:hypothetical protein
MRFSDIYLTYHSLFRRFTAGPVIVCRNLLCRSSCRFTRYSKLFPIVYNGSPKSTAVRKNRYVILPIDFEEAWKVSGFVFGCFKPYELVSNK